MDYSLEDGVFIWYWGVVVHLNSFGLGFASSNWTTAIHEREFEDSESKRFIQLEELDLSHSDERIFIIGTDKSRW